MDIQLPSNTCKQVMVYFDEEYTVSDLWELLSSADAVNEIFDHLEQFEMFPDDGFTDSLVAMKPHEIIADTHCFNFRVTMHEYEAGEERELMSSMSPSAASYESSCTVNPQPPHGENCCVIM